MKPSWKEWAMLAISLALALGGVWLAVRAGNGPDRFKGIVCAAFFGLCASLSVRTLFNRRQSRQHESDLSVTLPYGTVLRMGKLHILFLGIVIAVIGVLFFLWGWLDSGWLKMGIGAFAALAGLAVLALTALGIAGTGYLAFEAGGLRLGDRSGSMLMEWDNFARLSIGEYNRNQMVCFWFKSLEALALTGTGESGKWSQEGILREIGRSRPVFGCDWGIMTGLYGVNATLLAKALATYASDPKVREGLADHLRLEDKKDS
jgi:hypothetical protein